jgi:phosphate transport system protein
MSKKFVAELEELKEGIQKMGALAQEMMCKSIEALKKQDDELADEVLLRKKELAEMDTKLEEKSFQLIALYQPMASDMRIIGASLKIVTYLNRIGRYGKDIANIAKDLSKAPHIAKLVSIPHMNDIVCGMVTDSLTGYKTGDLSPLEDIVDRDDCVDALRYSIFRECISYMMEDPKSITRCMNYVMVARYLERCADHAVKIAEKVIYMVTGELPDLESKISKD